MRKKIALTSAAVLLTVSSVFGCSSDSGQTVDNKQTIDENNKTAQDSTDLDKTPSSDQSSQADTASAVITEEEYDDEDFTRILVTESESGTDVPEQGVTVLQSTAENTVYLKSDSAETLAQGVTIENTTITISSPGIYIITGTLNDGQLVVDCQEKGTVELVFYNANIKNTINSPVFIKDSKKTLLVLAENSVNSLSDASEYTYIDAENEEPSACLFSKDDLVISGGGSLTVTGNFNNGIASKDTLKITGGTLTVTAENNAVKGKDCLMIAGGTFNITSKGDGLKSDNSDASLGYISILGGTFVIDSEEDGIQAESMLKITDGTFNITTGSGAGTAFTNSGNMPGGDMSNRDIPSGGMPNEDVPGGDMPNRNSIKKGWDFDNSSSSSGTETDASIKGVKAGTAMIIQGGTFEVNSEDDAFHSNGTFDMTAGAMLIATGDDGIHADNTLRIAGGEIDITQCYEGIESPDIFFEGGTAHIKASDDGLNAAGGELSSSGGINNGNKMGMMSNSTGTLTINDGYIYIDAAGDGLDSNGDLTINGGTVIVEGPTDNGNSAVDYEYDFEINGGYLLASGSSGMVEGVGSSSKQNSVTAFFNSSVNAGDTFAVLDSKGGLVMAFTPSKSSQCFIFSSPELVSGETYTISAKGSCDGEKKDGLYTEGSYQGGTELDSFTVSASVTTVGSGGMKGQGGMGGNMGGPGGMKGQGGRRSFDEDEMQTPENMNEPPELPNKGEMQTPENMNEPPELPNEMAISQSKAESGFSDSSDIREII